LFSFSDSPSEILILFLGGHPISRVLEIPCYN
jgi:hypothetical protein